MIFYIEMPSGRTVPIKANDEIEAKAKFHATYPYKAISYIWDK